MEIDPAVIAKVKDYVKGYMANFDPSHDIRHIQRVVSLAKRIQAETPGTSADIVTLCALLHDVGDKKYLKPGEDSSRLIYTILRSYGVSEALAEKVQTICLGVSFSSEIKDPERVVALIKEHPELAVVQDADRLDAIGAVGIGRAFAFGGDRNRVMDETVDHFPEKLVLLEGMMKTDAGRLLARERTRRVQMMQEWWQEETASHAEEL